MLIQKGEDVGQRSPAGWSIMVGHVLWTLIRCVIILAARLGHRLFPIYCRGGGGRKVRPPFVSHLLRGERCGHRLFPIYYGMSGEGAATACFPSIAGIGGGGGGASTVCFPSIAGRRRLKRVADLLLISVALTSCSLR